MKKSLGPKTLLYPTPVWVVGSYSKDGKPNVMTIAVRKTLRYIPAAGVPLRRNKE